MKICPNCNTQLEDGAAFCANCGTQFGVSPQAEQGFVNPQPAYDPFDHKAEFDPKDISENKVFAMIAYLLDTIGIIIALLASGKSPYTRFHVRQALKFTVVEILTIIALAVLFWTVIVPIVGGIFLVVLWVVKIICFFQICGGKAKEPAIIRSFDFLK